MRMYSADYAAERCLSICLSLTRRYSVETAKHIVKLSGRHNILVIPNETLWQYSDADPSNAGAEYKAVLN